MSYRINLVVSGEYACFSRPELKVERMSYDVPTPTAARGMLEAIYWKPAIRWVIDEIRVLKPIRRQSYKRNEVRNKISETKMRSAMKSGSLKRLHQDIQKERLQRGAMVLSDVSYLIRAHFVLTGKEDGKPNPQKHLSSFRRRASKGRCYHQPVLGTREFPARFELIDDGDLPKGIDETRELGLMLYDIDHERDGEPSFFFARMIDGAIAIPRPNSGEVLR